MRRSRVIPRPSVATRLAGTVVLLAVSLLAVPAGAATERDHPVTLDDYFTLAYVSEVAASPDGSAALYVAGRGLGLGFGALVALGLFAFHPAHVSWLPVPSRRPEILCLGFLLLALGAQPPQGQSWPGSSHSRNGGLGF